MVSHTVVAAVLTGRLMPWPRKDLSSEGMLPTATMPIFIRPQSLAPVRNDILMYNLQAHPKAEGIRERVEQTGALAQGIWHFVCPPSLSFCCIFILLLSVSEVLLRACGKA